MVLFSLCGKNCAQNFMHFMNDEISPSTAPEQGMETCNNDYNLVMADSPCWAKSMKSILLDLVQLELRLIDMRTKFREVYKSRAIATKSKTTIVNDLSKVVLSASEQEIYKQKVRLS